MLEVSGPGWSIRLNPLKSGLLFWLQHPQGRAGEATVSIPSNRVFSSDRTRKWTDDKGIESQSPQIGSSLLIHLNWIWLSVSPKSQSPQIGSSLLIKLVVPWGNLVHVSQSPQIGSSLLMVSGIPLTQKVYCLNPLKSGLLFWYVNDYSFKLQNTVSIPSNRVFSSDRVVWPIVPTSHKCLNPLKSGLLFWYGRDLNHRTLHSSQSPQIGSSLLIEWNKLDYQKPFRLNPLKSGLLFWCFVNNFYRFFNQSQSPQIGSSLLIMSWFRPSRSSDCLNPLKSGLLFWWNRFTGD